MIHDTDFKRIILHSFSIYNCSVKTIRFGVCHESRWCNFYGNHALSHIAITRSTLNKLYYLFSIILSFFKIHHINISKILFTMIVFWNSKYKRRLCPIVYHILFNDAWYIVLEINITITTKWYILSI